MKPTPDPGREPSLRLVVMGASAGGVQALRRVVRGFPADLPASVCVVLHISPRSPSALADILDRSGPLPCRAAGDHEPLVAGEILVAPPDRHLVIGDGRVAATVGPRENGHRPAIDVLFRSAAVAYDERVVGVVLSGMRDDGTAGLAMIKDHGGAAVVQDPQDALFPAMPTSALAHVTIDAVAPADRLAEAIVGLLGNALAVNASAGAAAAARPGAASAR